VVLEARVVMLVKDIMSTVVISVPSTLEAELAWQEMRTARIHHRLVVDDGRIAGVLSDRDLGGAAGTAFRAGKRVADVMTSRVIVVAPETTVADAARLLGGYEVSCLPVLDGKTLVGIVTTRDLIELVGHGRRGERPLRRRGPNSRAYASAKT
jgi:CBS-domain-containing membrane protein